MIPVLIEKKAEKDLKRIDAQDRSRLRERLELLGETPVPENLDIKRLQGIPDWLEMRVGTYRVIFRWLEPFELQILTGQSSRACLVARVLHRKDLERGLRTLPPSG